MNRTANLASMIEKENMSSVLGYINLIHIPGEEKLISGMIKNKDDP